MRSAPRLEVAIVVTRAAARRSTAIVEVARGTVLIGWPGLVRPAVLRWSAIRRWPAGPIVELARAALFE